MIMSQNDKDASLDGQLELKKRARRRLVGAAALALLAAIVLPMVMDHEPRQPVQDVEVRIPSQDAGGLASRILPSKPAVTPLPPAEPESKPEAKAEAKSDSKQGAKPEPKPETKTEPKPAVAAKEQAKAPEAVKAPAKAAEKPAEKSASKAEEARALAALSGSAGSGWVVHLGAYKEAGNVKVLTNKLKEIGLPSYTENSESPQGVRTRVRAGPFKSRDAAEQALAKIRKIGIDGSVVQK